MTNLVVEVALMCIWLYVLWRLRIYRHGKYGVTLIASSILLIVGLAIDIFIRIGVLSSTTTIPETLMIISLVGIAFAGLYMLRHWEEENKDGSNG